MNLKVYLEKINRSGCSQGCDFKDREIEIVRVPPPDEILGIIVSRDPTIDWLDTYRKERKNRGKLFDAIPKQLIERIKIFTGENINYLSKLIYRNVYWTYLHKCFTDKSDKKSKFKYKNANECADKWLKDELDHAINNKTRFIIALGNDVHKWICEW